MENMFSAVRRLLFAVLVMAVSAAAKGQTDNITSHEVMLTTDMGNIRIVLYDDTPLHRNNFLKLVSEGFYDGLLFHRVLFGFMIQTGDPDSRTAQPGDTLGSHSEGDKIPAEILFPTHYHRRGCIAAARQDDSVNPERASSGSQFYIVWGRRMNDKMLDEVQERLDQTTNGAVTLTPEIREAYFKYGGTPHLDGQYTVFGEIVEGLDVVDQIQRVPVDGNGRPLTDVHIIKAEVVKWGINDLQLPRE